MKTDRSSSAAIWLTVLTVLGGECTVLAYTFSDMRNALQWMMQHFWVIYHAFPLLETSTFQGQPNCSHQYILTHWAPGPGVKCSELCLCTSFWSCFHTCSSRENVRFILNFIGAKWACTIFLWKWVTKPVCIEQGHPKSKLGKCSLVDIQFD